VVSAVTTRDERALFSIVPRLPDLVPFVSLAEKLPTPVERIDDGFWVKRDDLTSSVYGGNKVRKFEFVLPVAARRGGPVITAGGIGSHHVLAAAIYCRSLGLEVEAVLYPQPVTADVRRTQDELAALDIRVTAVPNRYLMPVGIGARLAALASRRPYLLWPGASTPLGTLGYVSAACELTGTGLDEPDDVVIPLGSGGTAVGFAVGLRAMGWDRARVVAVRCADASVTNGAVLRSLEAGTAALLAAAGGRYRPAHIEIDSRWLGRGYGHPTPAGDWAIDRAKEYSLALEPTYTAKAFAAALDLWERGRRVLFLQTFAG
jgi:D-cysteine desulfhydrase